MLSISRQISGFIVLAIGLHGVAFCQTQPSSLDQSVQKALEGIPPELLPYVSVGKGTSRAPIQIQDAMDAAIRLAAEVDGDDDLRDRLLHECAMTALARGSAATAEQVAGMIRSHRAALLLVSVADHLLMNSIPDVDRAHELTIKAGAMLPLLKPLQAQRVLARLLVTGRFVGVSEATLAVWWDRLKDKEARAEVAVRLLARQAEEKGDFDRSLFLQETARLGLEQPVTGYLDAAEDLLGQVERRAKAKHDPQPLLAAAFEVLSASHTLHTELLVRWAARFYRVGHEDLARTLFEKAEKNLGAPHEQIARLYYHIAYLWKLRGRATVLQPRLEQVERQVSSFEQVYQPFACAWLSAAWEADGDEQRSAELMARAVRAASTNENPRMRIAGAAQICLCRAAVGGSLAPEAAALAAELIGTTVDVPQSSAKPSHD
jgi:hypothetical protein